METTFGKIENGKFFGGQTEQGFVFKDMEAFNDPKRRDDICYISEGGFEDREALTEAQARAEIEKGGADTHNSLFNAIKDDLEREYGRHKITNEFVERICAYVIQEVDWQCTQTFYFFYNGIDLDDDLVDYVVERAHEREDWESDWDDDCLRDFLHEKIGNSSNHDWDMILDEFVNLPNN